MHHPTQTLRWPLLPCSNLLCLPKGQLLGLIPREGSSFLIASVLRLKNWEVENSEDHLRLFQVNPNDFPCTVTLQGLIYSHLSLGFPWISSEQLNCQCKRWMAMAHEWSPAKLLWVHPIGCCSSFLFPSRWCQCCVELWSKPVDGMPWLDSSEYQLPKGIFPTPSLEAAGLVPGTREGSFEGWTYSTRPGITGISRVSATACSSAASRYVMQSEWTFELWQRWVNGTYFNSSVERKGSSYQGTFVPLWKAIPGGALCALQELLFSGGIAGFRPLSELQPDS